MENIELHHTARQSQGEEAITSHKQTVHYNQMALFWSPGLDHSQND